MKSSELEEAKQRQGGQILKAYRPIAIVLQAGKAHAK
jgi:hypothetical protein